MKIIKLKEVDSTHKYLREYVSQNGFEEPLAIYTQYQTNGIGSRGNLWEGKKGNLFFSFVLNKNSLPIDLQLQSSSIYFSYILKIILRDFGSNIWLKWPNDFYIENKKIGGVITTISQELIYCGIGLNLERVSDDYGYLDIKIDAENLLKSYFEKLEKKISWKEIFSDFRVEFQTSQNFETTIDNQKISLSTAILNDDGSIQVNNKKVFSLR